MTDICCSVSNYLPVFIKIGHTKQRETVRHKSNGALEDTRDWKRWAMTPSSGLPQRTNKKRDNDTGTVLNAHVATTDLIGDRRVVEHVEERRPFVWPANFSLLAEGLQHQGREGLLLRGEASLQKQCDPVQVPGSVRMVVWVQIPCRGSNRAHPELERLSRDERGTCQICISNWGGDKRQRKRRGALRFWKGSTCQQCQSPVD